VKPYHPAPATIAAGFLAVVGLHAGSVSADSFTCDMSAYKEAAGLAAAADGQALALTWAGAGSDEGRMRLAINGGRPVIAELAIRKAGGAWTIIATDLTPEFRVVSGWRRLDEGSRRPTSRRSPTSTTPV
jgi:hypothetical protein